MIQIISIPELRRFVEGARKEGKTVGVVPTMGALHEGHLSLVKIAKERTDVVIMTVFVNPTQFAPNEDFSAYPRDLQKDARLAGSAGVDVLFTPAEKEMYPEPYFTYVTVESLTALLEGKSRPTHFRGVTTVVAKLLNLTTPRIAVFGQKDAQQAIVIRRMAQDLNIPVEIVIAPIVREADGLAMSSRNAYLLPEERRQSTILSRSLWSAAEFIVKGERNSSVITGKMKDLIDSQPLAAIDYLSIADASTLKELPLLSSGMSVLISLAVRFGKTRLIDNILVTIS